MTAQSRSKLPQHSAGHAQWRRRWPGYRFECPVGVRLGDRYGAKQSRPRRRRRGCRWRAGRHGRDVAQIDAAVTRAILRAADQARYRVGGEGVAQECRQFRSHVRIGGDSDSRCVAARDVGHGATRGAHGACQSPRRAGRCTRVGGDAGAGLTRRGTIVAAACSRRMTQRTIPASGVTAVIARLNPNRRWVGDGDRDPVPQPNPPPPLPPSIDPSRPESNPPPPPPIPVPDLPPPGAPPLRRGRTPHR